MDLKKSGELIAQRRKELGLTQKELADLVKVTDKAVSRWETGKGFPETSLLQPLSNALGISITEIVNGELSRPEEAARQADNALLSALNYAKGMSSTLLSVLLFIFGSILFLAPLFVVGVSPILLWAIAAVMYIWAILLHWNKWPSPRGAQILSVVILAAALILQAIPGSTVLIFAGPDYRSVEYYSCFDLILVGYGMFTPWISAVLTAATLLMALILLIWKKEWLRNKVFICTIVAGVFMLLPVLLSSDYLTLMGFFVILLQLFSAMFQSRANAAAA